MNKIICIIFSCLISIISYGDFNQEEHNKNFKLESFLGYKFGMNLKDFKFEMNGCKFDNDRIDQFEIYKENHKCIGYNFAYKFKELVFRDFKSINIYFYKDEFKESCRFELVEVYDPLKYKKEEVLKELDSVVELFRKKYKITFNKNFNVYNFENNFVQIKIYCNTDRGVIVINITDKSTEQRYKKWLDEQNKNLKINHNEKESLDVM